MGKSAEAVERKGVGSAPLRKRVRKYLKAKGIDRRRRARRGVEWWRVEKKEVSDELCISHPKTRNTEESSEDRVENSREMISYF